MGGASEIAFNIIPVIEKSGGKVLVRAMVDEVIVEGRQTVGVKVRRCGPSGPEGGSIEIRAPAVISNAGVYNTLQRLLVTVQSLSQFFFKKKPYLFCFTACTYCQEIKNMPQC